MNNKNSFVPAWSFLAILLGLFSTLSTFAQATNCSLPSLTYQMTNPVCLLVVDGFPESFMKATLSNVPAGYDITNGIYPGWCVDYNGLIDPYTIYKPLLYYSYSELPPEIQHPNWNRINYLLNHKLGNAVDVQGAIWHFMGGPVPQNDPIYYPPSALALAMIADTEANGAGFVPGPGEVSAVICELGPNLQRNIFEVICPVPTTPQCRFNDFVYNDLNGNGTNDLGEPGITNVFVTLADCAGNLLGSTYTDTNGAYFFDITNALPGMFKLSFTAPPEYAFASAGPGPLTNSGATACFTMDANCVFTKPPGNNFFSPASVGDYVWEDRNHDGIQQIGELGIPGVLVTLCSNAVVIASTNTDANGGYLFTQLKPGSSYSLKFTAPAGFYFTLADQGNDNTDSDANALGATAPFSLAAAQVDRSRDAGLFRPASLGDFVWNDINHNGLQDLGEPGLSNIVVKLIDCASNTVIASGATDLNGIYSFNNLLPGSYAVRFTAPAGMIFTAKDAGGNDLRDSDADPVTGSTDCVTLTSGLNNFTRDAGLFIPQPCVQVVVNCPSTPLLGQALTYTVTLANCGSYTLNNVTVSDNTAGLIMVISALSAGATTNFTYTFMPLVCGANVISTVTAEADDSFTGQHISKSGSASCSVPCPCDLRVTKIACVIQPPGSTNTDCVTTFSGPDNAQVRYIYLVNNSGSAPVNNVSVIDDKLGPIAGSPIPQIPAGGTVILMATNTVSCSTTNTVIVSANGGQCEATAQAVITRCDPVGACTPAYPYASANPRTSIDFNESDVLRGFTVSVGDGCMPKQVRLWYNDEHALMLGVRRVIVKTASGSTTNDYPVTPLGSNPGSAINPLVGSTALSGDQAGVDLSGRPMYPALFVTDITSDSTSTAGDWQFGGTPILPHAVFGTWKASVRTVDKTRNPAVVDVLADADPAKNNWSLGAGDPVPSGYVNEGYGAEVRWDVDQLGLLPGHTYRLYFMVHDGDQNKPGGDTGQGCATLGVMTSATCPAPACPACVLGYPYASTNPRTSIAFNESDVLRAFSTNVAGPGDTIKVWYNDEHAMILGVRRVILKTAAGSTTNDYPVTPLNAVPGSAINPLTGTPANSGDLSGNDPSDRPMSPSLYITDITADPNSRAGDWQFGGIPVRAQAVFGTWKAAVRTVDKTRNPAVITVTPDADPALKNNWNLGGGDAAPAGLVNEGYGAEARWDINSLGLIPGHSYRLQVMVHDGDQNKIGGDAGQACMTLCVRNPFQTIPAGLGDFVWKDLNRDGLQNAGEPGLAGVTVQLQDCSGHVLMTTNTSATGGYYFGNLLPGNYKVKVIAPAGFVFTTQDVGSNDGLDSDLDPLTGMTACITLVAGEINLKTDAGLFLPPPPSPSISLTKTADKATVLPGQSVTFSYAVTNTGMMPLSNIAIVDDNATPGFTADDFTVGTIASLAPGQGAVLTATKFLPLAMCMNVNGTNMIVGSLVTSILPNGDVKVIYRQSRTVVDNTYGTPSVAAGWKNGHTFSDLTGSDKAQFTFYDTNGTVVLDFFADYLSASATFPSGYGTLGVKGGDGSMVMGSATNVLSVRTTIADNLNQSAAFYGYKVNSPSPEASFPTWDYVDGYEVIVSARAFGAAGFGSVELPIVHNSPSKLGFNAAMPVPCNAAMTNIAIVTASSGATTVTASAQAVVNVQGPATVTGAKTYTTYKQQDWGAAPTETNPAGLLATNFTRLYPVSLMIGGTKTIKLTSAAAVQAYLPDSKPIGVLRNNYTNPLTTEAGVIGTQVTALRLNVDFSNAGIFKPGLANLKVAPGNKLAGYMVGQVLSIGNAVLGGNTAALPVGVTLDDLKKILEKINNNFDRGTHDRKDLVP